MNCLDWPGVPIVSRTCTVPCHSVVAEGFGLSPPSFFTVAPTGFSSAFPDPMRTENRFVIRPPPELPTEPVRTVSSPTSVLPR